VAKKVSGKLHNAVQCPNCEEVLVSLHRHDFRQCSCGDLAIDGGSDYCRIVAKPNLQFKSLKVRLSQ